MVPNKYTLWRARVEELLAAHWGRALPDIQEVAATVVGMFDAGARDVEVEAFLRDLERAEGGAPRRTDEARLELVHQLHRAASRLEVEDGA